LSPKSADLFSGSGLRRPALQTAMAGLQPASPGGLKGRLKKGGLKGQPQWPASSRPHLGSLKGRPKKGGLKGQPQWPASLVSRNGRPHWLASKGGLKGRGVRPLRPPAEQGSNCRTAGPAGPEVLRSAESRPSRKKRPAAGLLRAFQRAGPAGGHCPWDGADGTRTGKAWPGALGGRVPGNPLGSQRS
jgi:hypothetical protein